MRRRHENAKVGLVGACFVLYNCPVSDKREGGSYISWGCVPKCDDLMKMTPDNAKMLPKCDDLMKMTPEVIKVTARNAKMWQKCDGLMKITPE